MIEAIMYSAIGFLTATLLALVTLPAVWRRAVRLTRRRIEGAIPVSMAEIQADKDQLRAGFAVATRRLELDTETLRARTADQWATITRQTEELQRRQARLDDTSARLADLEARHAELTAHDQYIESELNTRTADLTATSAALEATRSELAVTSRTLEDTSHREEQLQLETMSLTALRDTLHERISDLDRNLAATAALLANDRAALRQTSEDLSVERVTTRELTARLARTDAQLATATEEVTALSAELAALKTRAATLAERLAAAEALRDETLREAERITTSALSYQKAAEAAARQAQDRAAMIAAEKAMVDGALVKAREERAALHARLATLPPAPTAAPSSDDNAMLRERISDIAADVARMTAELEGPNSPINALLAANPPGKKKSGVPPTLADRIHALQDRATRERVAKERAPRERASKDKIAAPVTTAPVVPELLPAEALPQNQRAVG